jgi:hypothetical protein
MSLLCGYRPTPFLQRRRMRRRHVSLRFAWSSVRHHAAQRGTPWCGHPDQNHDADAPTLPADFPLINTQPSCVPQKLTSHTLTRLVVGKTPDLWAAHPISAGQCKSSARPPDRTARAAGRHAASTDRHKAEATRFSSDGESTHAFSVAQSAASDAFGCPIPKTRRYAAMSNV